MNKFKLGLTKVSFLLTILSFCGISFLSHLKSLYLCRGKEGSEQQNMDL